MARPIQSRWLLATQIGLTIFFGALAIGALTSGGVKEKHQVEVALLLTGISAACLVATVLRFGWLVPSFVLGIIVGALLDPVVKSGPRDAQMTETVSLIVFGAFVGLVVGLVLDHDWRQQIVSTTANEQHQQNGDSNSTT